MKVITLLLCCALLLGCTVIDFRHQEIDLLEKRVALVEADNASLRNSLYIQIKNDVILIEKIKLHDAIIEHQQRQINDLNAKINRHKL